MDKNPENNFYMYNINKDGIDLGLPSGNIWMPYNIGAKNIYDTGYLYTDDCYGFSWGELTSKMKSSTTDYKFIWGNGTGSSLTKYRDGDPIILESEDDVVTQMYGNNYCIPSVDDYNELIQNTKFITKKIIINIGSITKNYDIYIFTSKKNNKNIYFTEGDYWTSSSLTGSYTSGGTRYYYSRSANTFKCLAFSGRPSAYISSKYKYALSNVRGIIKK